MPFTAEPIHLASVIDMHVAQVLANGGDEADLLHSLYDDMGTFKQLMDISTPEEMQRLCEH